MIDDSTEDAALTQIALKDIGVESRFNIVTDGIEALSYLRQEPPHEAATMPDMILLDINLPMISGIETLARIRSDPNLTAIPVIMLTTSSAESDIARCYGLHANCYIVKPATFDEYVEIGKAIINFWFAVSSLPKTLSPSRTKSN